MLKDPVGREDASVQHPGDQFHGSAINLLQSKFDFSLLRFFRPILDGSLKALNQRIDQRGTRLGRQGEGVTKQYGSRTLHEFHPRSTAFAAWICLRDYLRQGTALINDL